jgi:hypothetical protein
MEQFNSATPKPGAAEEIELFQRLQPRAEIDVKHPALNDQCRHRFHSCFLGLLHTCTVSAEVHNLDGITACIQRSGNTLFSRNTNGATGVVESGSAAMCGRRHHAPRRAGAGDQWYFHPSVVRAPAQTHRLWLARQTDFSGGATQN